ncbi:uncharacterized protein BXZ73DRAFT_80208 [Epithele typhae]|uniref:uncharacterized protein n=1 Tax=Epithele typhae TaxID=378194 RepID=UPI0020074ECD|nr:uncharacterized protein BXZ73DRAFT_80208 [Epithele typhae]KAH9919964.1 hypothetical protein BXZ73DRAFT_80208 [Epithele typhae]
MSSDSDAAAEIAAFVEFFDSLHVNGSNTVRIGAQLCRELLYLRGHEYVLQIRWFKPFLAYDYSLTFAKEIDLFWMRKPTGASMLFFVNRYVPLILHVYEIVSGFVPLDDRSCLNNVLATQAITVFQYLPWAVPVALNLFRGPRNLTADVYLWISLSFSITSRGSTIAADAIVIIATWVATYGTTKLFHEHEVMARSLSHTLQHDGTIYFFPLSYVTLFTEPGLQDSLATSVGMGPANPQGTLQFAHVVGSMGSAISYSEEPRKMIPRTRSSLIQNGVRATWETGKVRDSRCDMFSRLFERN